ncbi:MAG: phage tail protein [Acetobacter sp.]|nr:phage tail protein [Acetobacter sp.]
MDKFNDACIAIANDGNAYHPVANNHFTVTITLPKGLKNYADPKRRLFGPEGKEAPNSDNSILTLKIANDTFKEPDLGQQKLGYQKGNLKINFPGTIDEFSTSSEFHVFVNRTAFDLLYSWKMASGDHLTGEVGDPYDYWAEVRIDITTGNKGTLVGSWVLHNVWCSKLSTPTFSNSSNETRKVTIQLEYFKPEYINGRFEEA